VQLERSTGVTFFHQAKAERRNRTGVNLSTIQKRKGEKTERKLGITGSRPAEVLHQLDNKVFQLRVGNSAFSRG